MISVKEVYYLSTADNISAELHMPGSQVILSQEQWWQTIAMRGYKPLLRECLSVYY
jgi:hypothetical protein